MRGKKRLEKLGRHANFGITEELYKKFRIVAAIEGLSMSELYMKAAEEYLERHGGEYGLGKKESVKKMRTG